MNTIKPIARVLIVGAGPTGMVLALWLARLGVPVRLVDKTAAPGTTSRALAVQIRTLEFYRQLGIANEVTAHGHWVETANLWVAGRQAARLRFGAVGKDLSAYPGPIIYPQDEHERMLVDQLASVGVMVERCTELLDFAEVQGHVSARVRGADGVEESVDVEYIAGCDGAHSRVREILNIGFPGGTYRHLFYVADVEATGEAANGELHVALDASDFLAIFPLQKPGAMRLVGTVRRGLDHAHQSLSWGDVSQRVVQWLHLEVNKVNWLSTYRVHHRVAQQFRIGCAFLLGDAAHIHSPAGGQGMNTGIGDAVNLAWKLAAVLQARGAHTLLDTYEPERIAFARRLVKSTDRAFREATSSKWLARRVRLDVVPVVAPLALHFRVVRRFMLRTISQLLVSYPYSALSEGRRAGTLRAGQRLPWLRGAVEGEDNFAPLSAFDWQVHVFGIPSAEFARACEARNLPLHTFVWQAAAMQAGFTRDAAYLVRPDGYIALISASDARGEVESYLDRHGIIARGSR
jgi:2-polyprenyl-6-methoxyphenol hydroxylase-like FAD-dependent oxidoreductase